MGITVITPATSDPITIDEAKAHLRVTETTDDGLIAGYILAARQYAEDYTRRVFMLTTMDYTIDYCWPGNPIPYNSLPFPYEHSEYYRFRIEIPLPPLRSVTSVSYVDQNGATQTLDPSQYLVVTNETHGFIEPAYNIQWPLIRNQPAAITVRFTAGWDFKDVPSPIREAIKLHVELIYDRSPDMRETLEMARDSLLDHYRTVRIL